MLILRTDPAAWQLFAAEHYLPGPLHRAAQVYLAVEGMQLAACCATLHNCGWPKRRRITPFFVHPTFRGRGLGLQLAEQVAARETAAGYTLSLVTSSPSLTRRLHASPAWRPLWQKPHGCAPHSRPLPSTAGRPSASFVFLPAVTPSASAAPRAS